MLRIFFEKNISLKFFRPFKVIKTPWENILQKKLLFFDEHKSSNFNRSLARNIWSLFGLTIWHTRLQKSQARSNRSTSTEVLQSSHKPVPNIFIWKKLGKSQKMLTAS
jgi:hypothetical protein